MKKITAIALALVMLLALCACGSTPAPADPAPAATPAADTPAPADDANEPATQPDDNPVETTFTTVEPGKLHMSTNAAFPPYEMVDDNGNFIGIDVEVATEIAKKLGLELVVMDIDFDAALLAVQNGQSDIAMAGITVKPDRLEVMDFSDFYAKGVQVVIVPDGSDITLDNLGDQLIGTQRGTTGYDYCSGDYGEDHVVAYDNGATAIQALLNGQVDCVVIDNEPAKAFVAANNGLTILDTAYADEDYAIALSKGSDLLEPINQALKELQDDGTVAAIVGKYIKAE